MDKSLQVSKSIEIKATPAQVWHALTTPKIISAYFFGTEVVCDWEAGKPIVFQGDFDGHKYRDHGTILEIVPEQVLHYDYWSGFSGLEDKPENYSFVTYRLHPTDSGTTLSLVQQGFANAQAHEHGEAAWGGILAKLKEIVEE